jgi:DNA modification methylase/ribonuclease HI
VDVLTAEDVIARAVAAGQLVADRFAAYRGDCIEVMQKLPDASVGLSLYSPPFGGMLYQYSSDPADLSNCKDYDEFFAHYAFVVRELHRLTMPGRMTAVHCQDIAVMKGDANYLIDFPGHVIRCHEENGWRYVARYHVWKEPLMVRNRTMVNSLHHKTLCEDSTRCSIANADTLLIFRRSGKNEVPVAHPTGLMNYAGSRQPPENVLRFRGHKGNQIENAYSQWVWRQYASAFWDDVRIDRTLGTGASLYSANKADKDEPDERHMHPLQLDVIERAVVMWSNPGETVLTPFMGVGLEVYGAVVNGRRGVGVELKEAYFRQALMHLRDAAPAVSGGSTTAAQSPGEWVTRSMLDILDVEHAGDGSEQSPPPAPEPTLLTAPADSPPEAPAVTEVFADGGVVLVNPSPHGGTWAWCHVSGGERVREAGGTVTPAEIGMGKVSNNQTEFLALLLCLEALPDGWSGKVFTDSGVTLQRFRDAAKTNGIPPVWVRRLAGVRHRLGELEYVLLGGHPSKADLARGSRSDGKPVSAFNKWCDEECGRRAKELTPTPAEA